VRELPTLTAAAGFKPTAATVIGQVVTLRDSLDWY